MSEMGVSVSLVPPVGGAQFKCLETRDCTDFPF